MSAIFEELKDKLGIIPMDEPFTYLRRLQDSYNYRKLTFSKEYYELLNTCSMEETPSEWKVTLDGGFHPKRGKSGKEITLNKQVVWGDEWKLRNESPTAVEFRPKLTVNGELLRNSSGPGQTWISSDILGNDIREERYGRWILDHYGLDTTKAWVIRRCSFIWEEHRKVEIDSLTLSLERDKVDIPGIRFHTLAIGESVSFVHPITDIRHSLTVQEYKRQKMDEKRFCDKELEFPGNFAAMTYTIVPELARDAFMLKDCNSGDSPRPKNSAKHGCCAMSVGAIAMIRSEDGPVQVYYVN